MMSSLSLPNLVLSFLQNALPDVLNAAVGDFNFKNVISKLGDVMYKFPFSLPPFYIAIIRCLGVLEGLAIQVDSNFRIINDAYPYIASRLLTDPSEDLQRALQQLLFTTDTNRLRWDRLEELLEQATSINDYDATQALDQLIKYLVSPQAKNIRENLASELINSFDVLESEATDLLLKYAASGEISVMSLANNMFQIRGDGRGLDSLIERLVSIGEREGAQDKTPALYSLARAIRVLRRSMSMANNGNAVDAATATTVISSSAGQRAVSTLVRKVSALPFLC